MSVLLKLHLHPRPNITLGVQHIMHHTGLDTAVVITWSIITWYSGQNLNASLNTQKTHHISRYGPLTRYVKLQVAHAPGMPGTFSPAADFKGNRWLAIPTCITARAWRTCRDACRDRLPAVTGKTFPAFPAHAHPQICVSGKRPMTAPHCIRQLKHNYTYVMGWYRESQTRSL